MICERLLNRYFSSSYFLFSTTLYRSRSATPLSYPGTPPQHHPNDAIGASNYAPNTANTGLSILPTGTQMKANEFAPRNYSDFIRNLAAKYNNNNPNEWVPSQFPLPLSLFQSNQFKIFFAATFRSSNSRNLFFDPRFNISPLKPVSAAKDSPSPPENLKRLPTSSAASAPVSERHQKLPKTTSSHSFPFLAADAESKQFDVNNIPGHFVSIHSISATHRHEQHPSLGQFGKQLNRLPYAIASLSLIGLLLQARVAKEAEIQQILKGPTKRATKSHLMSNNRQYQQQSPSSNPNASPQNRMPTALQYMSLQQKASSLISQSLTATAVSQAAAASTSTSSGSNSNETHIRPASPLDLSASMPITKRLKMESPSPVRSLGSPPATQLQPSQSISRNRAQTPSVAGMTTSSNVVATAGVAANASSQRRCHAQSDEINSWTVAQVCDFVSSIDICAEYVEVSENMPYTLRS